MFELSQNDPSSFSAPEECFVTHLHMDLHVNFEARILTGTVQLSATKRSASVDKLILDTSNLTIKSVINVSNNEELQFTLGSSVATFGSPLQIHIPEGFPNKFEILISYETSPGATALQWLNPEQTCGGKYPYLFSQCQAIHARSMVPCQDSPGVKMPYSAVIHAPKDLVTLMSSLREGSEPDPSDESKSVHRFNQPVPMPSYLIAIVVGDLVSREIGPRSKVWCEKEMIEAAAYEFAETEAMVKTAEDLLGPYVWGIYDLLVLPPSFPYGGMENPCLTFVTPTCIAGDRSLATVVAHEAAHSWTGNLVTNRNPEHFWLNEGHTVFVERKIVGRLMGENMRQMLALDGWRELHNQIEDLHQPYTHLVPVLHGVDPDDAFSRVPYEKGSSLLMYLEQLLGGPDVFEPFLKAYIEEFKYKSIDTSDWKQFLYRFFNDKKEVLDQVDWNVWFHAPGMPPVKPQYDMTLTNVCIELAGKWINSSLAEIESFSSSDIEKLNGFQKVAFLNLLLENPEFPIEKVLKMNELYNFHSTTNAEIRFRWLRLCIRAKAEWSVGLALKFVTEQGRMKFVRPVYRDLYEWQHSRVSAQDNFIATRNRLHPVASAMLAKDLHIASVV